MAQEQADLSAGRTYRLSTVTHASAPTDGVTEPTFVLSPQAPGMLPTTGFLLDLSAPSSGAAVPNAGGFEITVWRHDPILRRFFAWEPVFVDFRQDWGTSDVDACEFYLQIAAVTTPGNVDVTITEQ